MDAAKLDTFRRQLLRQRETLFREAAAVEADLQEIVDDRESEFEEAAQEERTARFLTRLDDRSKAELQEIDAALRRIADGGYGTCTRCRQPIPLRRLAALPATSHCRRCAEEVERGLPVQSVPGRPA